MIVIIRHLCILSSGRLGRERSTQFKVDAPLRTRVLALEDCRLPSTLQDNCVTIFIIMESLRLDSCELQYLGCESKANPNSQPKMDIDDFDILPEGSTLGNLIAVEACRRGKIP